MTADGPSGDTRRDVDALADKLALDLLDARQADEGVLYVVPFGDEYDAALGVARELVATLAERGRVIEVEAIRQTAGIGLLLRDVTAA
jgi:hypothetical protein